MTNFLEKPLGHVVDGPPLMTFFRFVLPSVVSLTAISTTGFVDSVIVGRFVGPEALAAISLLMPYITFLFAVALMLAVGGGVRASLALGAGDKKTASSVFSMTLLAVLGVATLTALLGNVFSGELFRLLGGTAALVPKMGEYFPILSVTLIVQLGSLVLYYFIRADENPGLGTKAMLTGAVLNIAFDYLLVGRFGLGLRGSALGTLLAQLVQLAILASYFRRPGRNLRWLVPRQGWGGLCRSAANGASEFVNEVSVGLVLFTMNTLLLRRHGTDGVAAWNIINAFIFVSLMIYYGVADTMPVLFCRNIGAGRWDRVRIFFRLAAVFIGTLALLVTALLVFGGKQVVGIFLTGENAGAETLAVGFASRIWPMFLVSGFNVLICCYLASRERALPAAVVALLRSLVLPVVFGVLLYRIRPDVPVVVAFAASEWVTFAVALTFLWRYPPVASSETAGAPASSSPAAFIGAEPEVPGHD